MPYSQTLQDLITKISETRTSRLKTSFQRLSTEEKETLLKSFHPDYIPENFQEISVGPNTGDKAPRELVEIIEGSPLIDPQAIDLSQPNYECDVLVIGGGGAGCAAAITAQENGAKVIIATKLRLGDANTMMAQGGIQAATQETDSPDIHYLDVMGGGHYANFPDLVSALVLDGPKAIQWLEELGVIFDKMPDGTMKTIHGGGTSKKRMHTARDYTGAEIMRVLRDEVYNRRIEILEFSPAVEFLTDENRTISGAILLKLGTLEFIVVKAKTVILSTGGSGRLHYQGFPTSNHYGATGDGLILAYRAGAKLVYLDTMQYHPTGVAYPQEIIGQLVTEKVRSLGAQLVNKDGAQFIYPLETRDVVSSAIIRECKEGRGIETDAGAAGVWLDTPMIDIIKGPGTTERELPAMVRQYKRFGIEIMKEPVLVYPTLHYQNGGIIISPICETTIPNLYACGEVTGGVHGRNRLMGNSLLDVIVFGRRAGLSAVQRAKSLQDNRKITLNHLIRFIDELKRQGKESKLKSPILFPDYTRKIATETQRR